MNDLAVNGALPFYIVSLSCTPCTVSRRIFYKLSMLLKVAKARTRAAKLEQAKEQAEHEERLCVLAWARKIGEAAAQVSGESACACSCYSGSAGSIPGSPRLCYFGRTSVFTGVLGILQCSEERFSHFLVHLRLFCSLKPALRAVPGRGHLAPSGGGRRAGAAPQRCDPRLERRHELVPARGAAPSSARVGPAPATDDNSFGGSTQ